MHVTPIYLSYAFHSLDKCRLSRPDFLFLLLLVWSFLQLIATLVLLDLHKKELLIIHILYEYFFLILPTFKSLEYIFNDK